MSVTCSICMEAYDTSDVQEVVAINSCGHIYHRNCLLAWKNSSQRTSCPECRTKWTNRALKKLFLNIIPPDNQVNEDRLMTQLVEHKSIAEKMMRERDVIDFEKTQLMVQLAKSHDEYKKVMQHNEILNRRYLAKCQASEESQVTNDGLTHENKQLQDEMERLHKELNRTKAQQLKASKPFVDLTNDDLDDDSDIEIVEVSQRKSQSQGKKVPEQIQIFASDEEVAEVVEVRTTKVETVVETVDIVQDEVPQELIKVEAATVDAKDSSKKMVEDILPVSGKIFNPSDCKTLWPRPMKIKDICLPQASSFLKYQSETGELLDLEETEQLLQEI